MITRKEKPILFYTVEAIDDRDGGYAVRHAPLESADPNADMTLAGGDKTSLADFQPEADVLEW